MATTPEAYDAYLRGAWLLSSEAGPGRFLRARESFARAIDLDPGFAPAYVGLARARTMSEVGPESRRAVREALSKAIALDDDLPTAHSALAMLLFYREFDVDGARRSFERAIEINPDYAEAHQSVAACYSVRGQHDLAIASVQQARRIDPLSSMIGSDIGWYYYFARRFDEAIEHCRRTRELDPGFYWAELCIQLSLQQQGDWAGLVEEARRQIRELDPEAEELARLENDDPKDAARTVWEWRLRHMEIHAQTAFVAPADLAQLHMALGNQDRALQLLEEGFELRAGWILPFLTVDPLFDPLRGDPRFDDLVTRIAGDELRASR